MILSTKSHRLGIWWECNFLPQNENQRQDESGKKEKEGEQERQEKALLAQPVEDVVRKRFHEEDVVCTGHPSVVPRQDGGELSNDLTWLCMCRCRCEERLHWSGPVDSDFDQSPQASQKSDLSSHSYF